MAKYRFEEIAINSTAKKMPTEEDRIKYIGLEHLDSGSLFVKRWGSAVALKGEKLIMRKGDVLLGKRNAYLRRAGIAPHDGIFSAHGMVLRPRTSIIDESFFPLFVASDRFFDTAVRISVGSLSPTVNWKDLRIEEFDLPDIATQRKLATVLWSVLNAIESYKQLISATDALVKSQFIEMFGDPELNPYVYPVKPLKGIATVVSGITKGRKTKSQSLRIVPYLSVANVKDGLIDLSEVKQIAATEDEIVQYSLKHDDVLMTEGGDPDKLGRGCTVGNVPPECIYQNHLFRVRLDKTIVNPTFFEAYIKIPYVKRYFLWCAKQTTGIASINKKQLGELPVICLPLPLQERFVAFVRQADKSKFELRKALEELTGLYKRIISDNLG